MIPKVIHYCWFGGNPLPADAIEYIETWKKYCPDYEIKEWNEKNFDLTCCPYVQQAYQEKKWAFVSDVARLHALVTEGGIYMDTDVEVCKSLDSLLKHRAFSGFENKKAIPTGIMACEKDFPLFKDLLQEYENRPFLMKDGTINKTTNVVYITERCLKNGLKLNNSYQEVEGFALYPTEYFCPKDYESGLIHCTENTYTIHHFSSSWNTLKVQKWHKLNERVYKKLGSKWGTRICRNPLWRTVSHLYTDGVKITIQKAKNELKNKNGK